LIPPRTADFMSQGAVEGNRNQELFQAACQLRDTGMAQLDTVAALAPSAVASGLRPSEVQSTVQSAFSRGARNPAGVASSSLFKPIRLQGNTKQAPRPVEGPVAEFLRAGFSAGETLRVCASDADGRPLGRGELVSYESLLENPPDVMNGHGAFVSVNPLKDGITDRHVTDYRHCLVEFDEEPLERQWALIEQSRLPVSAVIYSGGKSLHAWVRVNAASREEYDERGAMVYSYFSNYRLDTKNKNPSRLSRLPGAMRDGTSQDLLAVNLGLPNWGDWIGHMESLSYGPLIRLSELRGYLDNGDANSLLGERWLCKGGSCVLSGASGIGKSSLAMQMAMLWAVGRPAFGIKPVRPLKSLIIQAENDRGDLAEQVEGMEPALGVDDPELLDKNIAIIHCTGWSGDGFIKILGKLVARHQPDLCWIDPLFSYIGGDTCSQEICSRFLREGLNPIAARTGVVWMVVHHTAKPREQDFGGAWQSYEMFGSAELVNWARAICVLKPRNGNYCLALAKRGNRARGGDTLINLKQSREAVCWEEFDGVVRSE